MTVSVVDAVLKALHLLQKPLYQAVPEAARIFEEFPDFRMLQVRNAVQGPGETGIR